jgi:hypothetical protein
VFYQLRVTALIALTKMLSDFKNDKMRKLKNGDINQATLFCVISTKTYLGGE